MFLFVIIFQLGFYCGKFWFWFVVKDEKDEFLDVVEFDILIDICVEDWECNKDKEFFYCFNFDMEEGYYDIVLGICDIIGVQLLFIWCGIFVGG